MSILQSHFWIINVCSSFVCQYFEKKFCVFIICQQCVAVGIIVTLLWFRVSMRWVRCEANFVSSGSKIVKRLRRRKYEPIDHREYYRSCTWSFYSLVQIFPRALHSD